MKRNMFAVLVLTALLQAWCVRPPVAQAEDLPFVGQMLWVPYNFAPRGWAFCDGQILPIAQNTALFSLLGTTYGGNGSTTFALPDMRGRMLVNAGSSGGSTFALGESGGETQHTLTASEIPAHSHVVNASNSVGTATSPQGKVLASSSGESLYGPTAATAMAAQALGSTGGGQPHNNMMPFTTLNCIIALQGIYPSRP